MVLRILHPILASTLCAANPLARIAEPTIEMLMGNLVSASTGQLWTEIASCAPRHLLVAVQAGLEFVCVFGHRRGSSMDIVLAFSALCILLVVGKILRVTIRLFQKLYLPASVIGGLLGLALVQTIGGFLPEATTAGWTRLPGFLINIVFAGHIPLH